MDALVELRSRLADLQGLEAIASLLVWDQRTMMPDGAAALRGQHLGLLERLGHERLVSPELGRLLDEAERLDLDPDSDDGALVRLARRTYDKAVRVPSELMAEMAQASSEGVQAWAEARAASDFARFLPALERNVGLRRRYVECFEPRDEPYDILLDDFEPDMETAEVRRIFEEIKPELVVLAAERREAVDDSFLTGDFPVDRQAALSHELVELLGTRPATWRVDPTLHPFAAHAGRDDIRITTHYDPANVDSLFATIHEYGHGLYEHQIPESLTALPTGTAASLGLHESQSRLWENLVGRSDPFWRFFYPRLRERFPEALGSVERERFVAGINKVEPSLIRIHADEVTYGLHVMLRFELEQDIVNGRVELRDLPEAWNRKMWEYLGVEVPDDAHGVLQDMHWAAGLIGYFSTYLLGTVMSVQIWQAADADLGDLEAQIERGECAPLRDWLRDNVHAHGRKFSPQETLRRATGSTIDAKPYLAYLRRKYGAPVAA